MTALAQCEHPSRPGLITRLDPETAKGLGWHPAPKAARAQADTVRSTETPEESGGLYYHTRGRGRYCLVREREYFREIRSAIPELFRDPLLSELKGASVDGFIKVVRDCRRNNDAYDTKHLSTMTFSRLRAFDSYSQVFGRFGEPCVECVTAASFEQLRDGRLGSGRVQVIDFPWPNGPRVDGKSREFPEPDLYWR